MSTAFRRFEVLVPLKFNDGMPVPPDLLTQTFLEIRTRFGSISVETQSIRGSWLHQGQTYEDELVRFFVDVADDPEHVQFFRELKDSLKARFQQLDIWVTHYAVEVL